jgi:hypothetical protein
MKTKITWIAVALAGIATATAEDAKPERKGPGPHHRMPPAVLEEFDKNNDGKLDGTERKAAREAMHAKREQARAKMLAEFDANQDGKLDEAERQAMREAREAKHKALLEKYDADQDGKLDRKEREAARDAGEEIPMGPHGPHRGREGKKGPRGEGGKRQGPPAGE